MLTQVTDIVVRDDSGALRKLQKLTPTSETAKPGAADAAEYLLEGVPAEKIGDKAYRVTSTGMQLTEVDESEQA